MRYHFANYFLPIVASCLLFSFNDNLFCLGHQTAPPIPDRIFDERDVNLKLTYKVTVDGHLNRLVLKMNIPDDLKDRQSINDISFSIEPDSIYKINENKYALFRLYDVEKSFKIVMKSKITLYRNISNKNDTAKVEFGKFLLAEKNIESDSPRIKTLAASLKKKTDIETVMETFEYVTQHISYELNPAIGAEKVLETHVGKCMDYSDLFVALLRANNIPAKSNFGIVVDYSGDNPLHAWSEAYLKKQGWIRFDATTGHSDISRVGKDYLMKISNKYITLSEGRNDPELNVHQYHYYYTCSPGSKVRVKLGFDIAAQ